MSGPSAIEKPISEKIAASSSITWLIGCTRPSSSGLTRAGRVTSSVSVASRISSAAAFNAARRGKRFGDAILDEIDRRALVLSFFRRQFAEAGQKRRQRSLFAERGDADGFERTLVFGGVNGGERFTLKCGKIGHYIGLASRKDGRAFAMGAADVERKQTWAELPEAPS